MDLLEIPVDIISIIISYVPVDKNLINVRLVCRLFLNLSKKLHDISFNDSYVLQWACRKGYIKLVKELLADSRIDPRNSGNICLSDSLALGHTDVYLELINDKRIDIASKSQMELALESENTTLIEKYFQEFKSRNIQGDLINAGFVYTIKRDKIDIASIFLKDEFISLLDIDRAIISALYNKKDNIILFLLNTMKIKDYNSLTQAFSYACMSNNLAIALAVLKYNETPTFTIYSYTMSAIGYNNYDIFRELIKDDRFDPMYDNGFYIFKCIKRENNAMAILLLGHNKTDLTFRNNSFFITAVNNNSIDIVIFLIQRKEIDPSYEDNISMKIAIKKSYLEIIDELLKVEKVNKTINIYECIYLAVKYGHLSILLKFLHFSHLPPDFENNFILNNAVKYNRTEIISYLLKETSVNPSAFDNEALKLAIDYESFKALEILVKDKRVDPSIKDNKAFRKACSAGKYKIVKILLEDNRVDPTVKRNKALIKAVRSGDSDLVKLLLKNPKVDPSDRNYMAISLAYQKRQLTIVDIFKKHEKLKHIPLETVDVDGYLDLFEPANKKQKM